MMKWKWSLIKKNMFTLPGIFVYCRNASYRRTDSSFVMSAWIIFVISIALPNTRFYLESIWERIVFSWILFLRRFVQHHLSASVYSSSIIYSWLIGHITHQKSNLEENCLRFASGCYFFPLALLFSNLVCWYIFFSSRSNQFLMSTSVDGGKSTSRRSTGSYHCRTYKLLSGQVCFIYTSMGKLTFHPVANVRHIVGIYLYPRIKKTTPPTISSLRHVL